LDEKELIKATSLSKRERETVFNSKIARRPENIIVFVHYGYWLYPKALN
jgi:hypothetical protein